ncbi:hypothetical protein HaLaN_26610 [Haematococcus lacustris]|uniref:Uncharacterized protein n=1 Tax=Haematococcus lacustris TaxID=44745 RepID=A0A6A0A6K3_HAELA|nr:hypothetical protein HaLaN_26610 [Haematococcus lacustris]
MAKKKRKGADNQKKGSAKVIKVPGGAVLRGCKKTKRKLLAHLQLRAEVHSQLRPASMEWDCDSDSNSPRG